MARPRALIVIAKASREDGQLSEKVEAFIESKLDLRTRLPGLELLDDGSLIGGFILDENADALVRQQSKMDEDPGIPVGPDSQPTLSFTSGSEGIPKGCKYVVDLLPYPSCAVDHSSRGIRLSAPSQRSSMQSRRVELIIR